MITATAVRLRLPYPPTVNMYWRYVQGRVLISKAGRQYRENIAAAVVLQRGRRLTGRLSVGIIVHPPDRRTRDIDNVLKGTLDSLCHAGVYDDDGQIDSLFVSRGEVVTGGLLVVEVEEIEPE